MSCRRKVYREALTTGERDGATPPSLSPSPWMVAVVVDCDNDGNGGGKEGGGLWVSVSMSLIVVVGDDGDGLLTVGASDDDAVLPRWCFSWLLYFLSLSVAAAGSTTP